MVYNPYQRPQLGPVAAVSDAGMSAREIEASAFAWVNRSLREAETPHERVRALGRNHKLWAIIVNDVAAESCALPQVLRDDILRLGVFSMRESLRAMGQPARSVQAFLTINADMEAALRPGAAHPPAAAIPAMSMPVSGMTPSRMAVLSA